MNYLFIMLLSLFTCFAFSQENCSFNHYNKKGGHYLFSTYFKGDMHTLMEGTCQSISNGKIYEKRVFKNGRIIEEELNYFDFKPRIKTIVYQNPKDSVIAETVQFWENGKKEHRSIFYFDKAHRRCEKSMDYFLDGTPRFVHYYAFVRKSELNQPWEQKDYPPHTVDEEGYTYLKVVFGEELSYHENGKLKERINHQLILHSSYENSSKNGLFELYSDQGKLSTVGMYKDGNPDGKWVCYNYYGNVSEEKYYQRNMKVGLWKGWHDNGMKKYELTYDTTFTHIFEPSQVFWNDKGVKILERLLEKNGNGVQRQWTENGVLIEYTEIDGLNKYQSFEKRWFPSGSLKSVKDTRWKADTTLLEVYENGQMKTLNRHTKSSTQVIDTRKEWNEKGILLLDITRTSAPDYNNFVALAYYDSGQQKEAIYHKNNERIEEYFYANGKKKRELLYHNSLLQGTYKTFDSTGVVSTSISYHNGIRNGITRLYDKNGKLIYAQQFDSGCVNPTYSGRIAPKRRKLTDLSKTDHDVIYTLVYNQLFKYQHRHTQKMVYTPKEIDTLAQSFLWLYDEWDKKVQFPYGDERYGKLKLNFTLPISMYKGVESRDTSNKFVRHLVESFDSLGWKFPKKWQIENNCCTATYEDENVYLLSFVMKHFSYYYQNGFLSLSPENKAIERDIKPKFHQNSSIIFIDRISPCCFKARYQISGKNVEFIIYNDGSVEFYNQAHSWDDLYNMTIYPSYKDYMFDD